MAGYTRSILRDSTPNYMIMHMSYLDLDGTNNPHLPLTLLCPPPYLLQESECHLMPIRVLLDLTSTLRNIDGTRSLEFGGFADVRGCHLRAQRLYNIPPRQ